MENVSRDDDSLDRLGRRLALAAELAALDQPDLTAGRVLAQHRGHWMVAVPGGAEPRLLTARGKLRADPPVTGDWVAIDGDGQIAAVLERRGTIVRRAAGAATAAQVMAANVDLALIACPLPEPNERQVERMLALARSDGVAAAIVLTKADLAADPDGDAAHLAQRLLVDDAIALSTRSGRGLEQLAALLTPGTTSVVLGPSGAGKSTLINALLGEERQATGAVRSGDGRGRHTTVTRELIALPGGALMIDTPGVREVGLWDGGADETYSDIDELAAGCRFADCGHETEPGCAVRDAVEPDRLAAWRKLAREQEWVEDRRAAARQRAELGRSHHKAQRGARARKNRPD